MGGGPLWKQIIIIENIPSQSNSLTYTGSTLTPTWSNYDSTQLTIGGTTSNVNAGTYTTTFTPKSGYSWADGSVDAISVNWSIGRASIAATPSQSGTLTYSGSAQSPTWTNYSAIQLTIGGTTSSTNAGTYSATFTPKSNYQWSDGSTAAKSVSWSIAKAAGSLSISPTSMTFNNAATLSKTIIVTRAGNGKISAVSNNTSVATVSVSGNTITVTSKKVNGSATITVSVAAGTNHNAPSNKTCSVTASFTFELSYGIQVITPFTRDEYFDAYRNISVNSNGQIQGSTTPTTFTVEVYYNEAWHGLYPYVFYAKKNKFYKIIDRYSEDMNFNFIAQEITVTIA